MPNPKSLGSRIIDVITKHKSLETQVLLKIETFRRKLAELVKEKNELEAEVSANYKFVEDKEREFLEYMKKVASAKTFQEVWSLKLNLPKCNKEIKVTWEDVASLSQQTKELSKSVEMQQIAELLTKTTASIEKLGIGNKYII